MNFWVLNGALLVIIFILLLLLSMVWPPDSPWAPFWRTNKKIARKACKFANIKESDVVYELGSGDAAFLITAVKEFKAKGIGIEIDPLRALISTLLIHINKVSDKLVIKRRNFFDEDLSKASVIFVYLVPKALERLRPKFLKELKKGTKILSYRYQTKLSLIKKDEENSFYLYRV